MKLKKILKISLGVIIFFTLPTALLFGYVYFKYNEPLPISKPSPEADALALEMLDALNYDAYKNTDFIEFTFSNRHHFKWNKTNQTCEVYWKSYQVNLDLKHTKNSKVFVGNQAYNGIEKQEIIAKALGYFNNDTFWLVAPYKVFDKGTTRSIATNDAGEKGLLITYSSGGNTPGDSYLWHLDKNNKPKKFQMWTSILPIKGFPSSWSDWKTTETGAELPTFHSLSIIGIEISGIKTKVDSSVIYYPSKKSINEFSFQSKKVELDSLKNFKNLIKTIDSLRYNNIYPVVEFSNNDKKYKIRNFQQPAGTIVDYKCKDILEIYNSEIYQCGEVISNINNNYKTLEEFYISEVNNKMILITIDTLNSLDKTKEILLKIIESYSLLNKKYNTNKSFNIQYNLYKVTYPNKIIFEDL